MEAKQDTTKQPMSYKDKIPGDEWRGKYNNPKSMRCSKSSSRRKFYSDTSLFQETRNTSNKQPNLTHEGTKKRENKQPKVSRRKEIIKVRAEINEIET